MNARRNAETSMGSFPPMYDQHEHMRQSGINQSGISVPLCQQYIWKYSFLSNRARRLRSGTWGPAPSIVHYPRSHIPPVQRSCGLCQSAVQSMGMRRHKAYLPMSMRLLIPVRLSHAHKWTRDSHDPTSRTHSAGLAQEITGARRPGLWPNNSGATNLTSSPRQSRRSPIRTHSADLQCRKAKFTTRTFVVFPISFLSLQLSTRNNQEKERVLAGP